MQAARERAESVEKQVAGAQQRQREAEKLRAEAERRAKGADAALAAAKSENEQLQQALDKANKKHAKVSPSHGLSHQCIHACMRHGMLILCVLPQNCAFRNSACPRQKRVEVQLVCVCCLVRH